MEQVTVSITYCVICNFRGRAAWLAQELLTAHEGDIAAVSLIPAREGLFEVRFDGRLVFSRRELGRFPEPREVKDALREELGMEPKPRHD